jgi:hypothetical protein
VVSSEFCRATQTADFLDLGPTTEVGTDDSKQITYFVYDEAARCENSLALLATPPSVATNRAFVSHDVTTACDGHLNTLDNQGDTAIYKPDSEGGALFILEVPAANWPTALQ